MSDIKEYVLDNMAKDMLGMMLDQNYVPGKDLLTEDDYDIIVYRFKSILDAYDEMEAEGELDVAFELNKGIMLLITRIVILERQLEEALADE